MRHPIAITTILALAVPAAAAWGPPVQVSARGTVFPAGLPVLAVAPDGTAALAWQRSTPGRHSIEVAQRRSPGGPFEAPVEVDYGGRVFSGPAIAASPGSRALVAWARRAPLTSAARALTFGIPDLPSAPAEFPADGRMTRIHAGLGGATPRLLWAVAPATPGGGGTLWTTGLQPGGAWAGPSGVAADVSASAFAQAADGRYATAWVTAGAVNAAVDGGPATALGVATGTPAVAVTRGGRALVAWCGAGLWVAEHTAAGWSPPQRVGTDVPAPACALPPAVALAPDGGAVVAWRSSAAGRLEVRAAHRRAGGAWSPQRRIGRAPRNVGAPVAVIGATGSALVAWVHPVAASGSLIASRVVDRRSRWSGRSDVGVAGFRATGPGLGADAAGRVTLSWLAVPNGPYGRGLRVMSARRPSPLG